MAIGIVMIIVVLVPTISNSGKQADILSVIQNNFVWSVAPLFCTIGIVTAIYFLRFSKNPSAMKLFATIPAFNKSVLYREAVRTVFVRLAAPLIIIVGLLTLFFLPPWKVLANILVGLGLGLLITIINGALMQGTAPYSTVFQAGQVNSGATLGGVLIAMVVATVGGFAIVFLPWWLTLIAGVIILVGSWFILNHSYNNVHFTLPGETDFE
jgi:MFS family permease